MIGRRHSRCRAAAFRRFLDEVDAQVSPDLDIHLVPDNPATHGTTGPPRDHRTTASRDRLAKRPRCHVHFTPAPASWIDQVERWFAPLAGRALRRGVHRSAACLERDIRAFIDATSPEPEPVRRVKPADAILASVRRALPLAHPLAHARRGRGR